MTCLALRDVGVQLNVTPIVGTEYLTIQYMCWRAAGCSVCPYARLLHIVVQAIEADWPASTAAQVADAIELQQPGQPAQQLAQLRSCLAVVESAARGSDLHVLLAVKHAAKARLVHGGESAECRAADLAMGQAHVARCAAGGGQCGMRAALRLWLPLFLTVAAALLEHSCCGDAW